jgi:hypothetical protein
MSDQRLIDHVNPLIQMRSTDMCPSIYSKLLHEKPSFYWNNCAFTVLAQDPTKWLFRPFTYFSHSSRIHSADTYLNLRRLNTINQMCKAADYGIGPKVYEAFVCGDDCFAIIQAWSFQQLSSKPVITVPHLFKLLNICLIYRIYIDGSVAYVKDLSGQGRRLVFIDFSRSYSFRSTFPGHLLLLMMRRLENETILVLSPGSPELGYTETLAVYRQYLQTAAIDRTSLEPTFSPDVKDLLRQAELQPLSATAAASDRTVRSKILPQLDEYVRRKWLPDMGHRISNHAWMLTRPSTSKKANEPTDASGQPVLSSRLSNQPVQKSNLGTSNPHLSLKGTAIARSPLQRPTSLSLHLDKLFATPDTIKPTAKSPSRTPKSLSLHLDKLFATPDATKLAAIPVNPSFSLAPTKSPPQSNSAQLQPQHAVRANSAQLQPQHAVRANSAPLQSQKKSDRKSTDPVNPIVQQKPSPPESQVVSPPQAVENNAAQSSVPIATGAPVKSGSRDPAQIMPVSPLNPVIDAKKVSQKSTSPDLVRSKSLDPVPAHLPSASPILVGQINNESNLVPANSSVISHASKKVSDMEKAFLQEKEAYEEAQQLLGHVTPLTDVETDKIYVWFKSIRKDFNTHKDAFYAAIRASKTYSTPRLADENKQASPGSKDVSLAEDEKKPLARSSPSPVIVPSIDKQHESLKNKNLLEQKLKQIPSSPSLNKPVLVYPFYPKTPSDERESDEIERESPDARNVRLITVPSPVEPDIPAKSITLANKSLSSLVDTMYPGQAAWNANHPSKTKLLPPEYDKLKKISSKAQEALRSMSSRESLDTIFEWSPLGLRDVPLTEGEKRHRFDQAFPPISHDARSVPMFKRPSSPKSRRSVGANTDFDKAKNIVRDEKLKRIPYLLDSIPSLNNNVLVYPPFTETPFDAFDHLYSNPPPWRIEGEDEIEPDDTLLDSLSPPIVPSDPIPPPIDRQPYDFVSHGMHEVLSTLAKQFPAWPREELKQELGQLSGLTDPIEAVKAVREMIRIYEMKQKRSDEPNIANKIRHAKNAKRANSLPVKTHSPDDQRSAWTSIRSDSRTPLFYVSGSPAHNPVTAKENEEQSTAVATMASEYKDWPAFKPIDEDGSNVAINLTKAAQVKTVNTVKRVLSNATHETGERTIKSDDPDTVDLNDIPPQLILIRPTSTKVETEARTSEVSLGKTS